ncbi:MAG: PDZ domain-containing protein [Chitinophagaceae bacterium]
MDNRYKRFFLICMMTMTSGIALLSQPVADGKIGVVIELRDKEYGVKTVWIKAVIPNGPAAKAGLLADDEIRTIDGSGTGNLSLARAVEKLGGTPGSIVNICFNRDHKTTCIEVTRAGTVAAINSPDPPGGKKPILPAKNIIVWLNRMLIAYQGDLSDVSGERGELVGGGMYFKNKVACTDFSNQFIDTSNGRFRISGIFAKNGKALLDVMINGINETDSLGAFPARFQAMPPLALKNGDIKYAWLPRTLYPGSSPKALKIYFYLMYRPSNGGLTISVTGFN